MKDGTVVYTRDYSTGRVHKRSIVNGALQSFEADNSDTAGEYEVITPDALTGAESGSLCRRCFPPTTTTDGSTPTVTVKGE